MISRHVMAIVLAGASSLAQAQPARPEATSLLGKPLIPAPISAEARKTLEENLKNAEIVYGRNPDDPDATIWMGRRVAYLGRYATAEIVNEGLPTRDVPVALSVFRDKAGETLSFAIRGRDDQPVFRLARVAK